MFADPVNTVARGLEADALEQLGYQAESGVWRNVYLMGALELRNGVPAASGVSTTSADVIKAVPLGLFFDYLAVRLDVLVGALGSDAQDESAALCHRRTSSAIRLVSARVAAALAMSDSLGMPSLTTRRKCSSSGPKPIVAAVMFAATGTV